ncbi:SAM-dependent methyltransferase [Alkalihalobacillus alcalophilus ATCC 27647 = CGMCC 1.3604]|uniref:SAM-dependent methyltransferase n=1 Tax=Alkalihalobacillus alcalophilus ATCC 27647 = CGMCC 1.3604 TaxID=1218173 RepID=A0A4S4JXL7_ALKAL|nr:methyltransferase domain-containing protein [Alkalihalobacillus alcalophilus]MED1563222.1 methyltransferase domain-containing protein [Alkalihalobacillus alcalophilus]THG89996.1 SAM-dependent methyltransferase [Alkalihalobacillus alcalophilus ATCC 27647 = CGMCC 1.3604]
MSKSKKIKSAELIQQFKHLFKCPICQSTIAVSELKSFKCKNNHTFDFTKQGYLNLMVQQSNSHYDKTLFEYRHHLIVKTDFFSPLQKLITDIIHKEKFADDRKSLTILDVGCGEGSHLARILSQDGLERFTGFGLDIAKDGILQASKNYEGHVWLVGDLAKSPFADLSFQVLLNILSPSNYKEFIRLLAPNGIVIKVIPRPSYLKELRQFFFQKQEQEEYQNENTLTLFKENFHQVERYPLTYTKKLQTDELRSLVNMTPLTWQASEEKIEQFIREYSASAITVDLEVVVGKS